MNTAAQQYNPDLRRNGLISKIHVAKKQLALHDDSYRAVLEGATGKSSLRAMSMAELEQTLAAFGKFGFKAKKSPVRAGSRRMADGDQARKIRALWMMLYHLGEIADPSEEALAGFVERMSGCTALQWISVAEADKTIKGLRGWLERVGYYHPKGEDYRYFGTDGLAENISLINCQCYKLGIKDIYPWLKNNGFGEVQSLTFMDRDDLMQVIEVLGRLMRTRKAGHG